MAELIAAAEAALANRRGHIGIVPRDLRRIIERMLYDVAITRECTVWRMFGVLHRRGGAALISSRLHYTSIFYYEYGKVHCVDGPAVIKISKNSRIHSWIIVDKPARRGDLPTRVTWHFNDSKPYAVLAEWEAEPHQRFCKIANGIETTMRDGVLRQRSLATGELLAD